LEDALQIEMTLPLAAPEAEVDYTFSVKFRFNLTPLVARQKANGYLLMNVGRRAGYNRWQPCHGLKGCLHGNRSDDPIAHDR
jgi:hypothetical protein